MMRRYLTEGEQQKLLKGAQNLRDPLAQRDYWWMRLLLDSGMRVAEFSLLTLAQAESALKTGWLVLPAAQRKGGRVDETKLAQRFPLTGDAAADAAALKLRETCRRRAARRAHGIPVTAPIRQALEALSFMARAELGHGAGPEAPLVPGRDGAPLSVRSYQARLKIWVEEAGLDCRTSVHWLRHSCGMNILRRSQSKAPLKVVQTHLGHASLSSTGVYLQMSREDYSHEMQQIHGGRLSKAEAMRQAGGAA